MEMMHILEGIFERNGSLSKLFLVKKLLKLKFKSGPLQDNFAQVEAIIREMDYFGSKMEDNDRLCFLLLMMPESPDNVITPLETITAGITFDVVKNRLLDAELKLNEIMSGADNTSFLARRRKCYMCQFPRHLQKDCPNNRGNAHEQGYDRGRDNRHGNYRGRDNFRAHFSSNQDCGKEIGFMVIDGNIDDRITSVIDQPTSDIELILDSAASEHHVTANATSRISNLSILGIPVKVKIADGKILEAKSRGQLKRLSDDSHQSICFRCVNGVRAWTLKFPTPANKLEPRTVESRMVSYGRVGYRLWIPSENLVIASRDVIFDETDCVYIFQPPMVKDQSLFCLYENKEEVIGTLVNKEEPQESSREEPTTILVSTKSRTRDTKLPAKLDDYQVYTAYCFASGVPCSFEDAMTNVWEDSIREELASMEENNTWELVDKPPNVNVIDSKWIFAEKSSGKKCIKKARLVAPGYLQKECDEGELYSPVARMVTMCVLFSLVVVYKWKVSYIDVKCA
ncbi:hypothetical protein PR048_024277 [Dryococelus australis]|uniref:Uncharacterized protein n=1 Tax=Dryococelus australis TaxID=614101 RepID=A0ABQ9GN70_9NEOP|nr:hypothetical protein PR048_024277 [Dryococelus australis]